MGGNSWKLSEFFEYIHKTFKHYMNGFKYLMNLFEDFIKYSNMSRTCLNISLNGQTVLAMERVESKKGKVKTAMTTK